MSDDKGKGKAIDVEELVKDLIEDCLLSNMSREEVIEYLYEEHDIELCVSEIVLSDLEKSNPDFFEKYYPNLAFAKECSGSNIPPKFKNLIDECLVRNMSWEEIIEFLNEEHDIQLSTTEIILENLEKQNQDFFEKYYSKLTKKEQLKKQTEMMNQLKGPDTVASATECSGSKYTTNDHGASSLIEKMSTAENKQNEEKKRVKKLIKHYLMRFTSQKQVIDALYQMEKIEPSFSMAVWEELEKEYPEFFRNYSSSAPPPTDN